MKVYDAASIRNVAVVGHGGCGKTQLVSALLFAAGMVNRLGKVDEGTTVTDYDEEEIARKHTLAASLAYAEWNKTKINLIDTPGFGNFFADARAALRVADAALVVVDAVAGVEVQTEKAWARRRGAGAAAARRASTASTASARRSSARSSRCGRRSAAPSCRFSCRSAKRSDFSGVVDLVTMKAYTFAGRRLRQDDRRRRCPPTMDATRPTPRAKR